MVLGPLLSKYPDFSFQLTREEVNVRLRRILATHADFARKLSALEKRYDAQFRAVFDAIRELMVPTESPKKRRIGFLSGRS